jgi:hypothetical protein
VAKGTRNGARVLIFEASVDVALVSRCVSVGRTLDRRTLLLLGTSGSEVVSKNGSLHAVTVEDMVLGAVDVVIVLNSADVLNGLDRKSTVGLLAIVDRRVGRNDRSGIKLLGGSAVGVRLIRLLVAVVMRR